MPPSRRSSTARPPREYALCFASFARSQGPSTGSSRGLHDPLEDGDAQHVAHQHRHRQAQRLDVRPDEDRQQHHGRVEREQDGQGHLPLRRQRHRPAPRPCRRTRRRTRSAGSSTGSPRISQGIFATHSARSGESSQSFKVFGSSKWMTTTHGSCRRPGGRFRSSDSRVLPPRRR